MKILMLSDVYFPRVNGVSTSIQTFCRELVALGHEVAIVAPDYGSDPEPTGFELIRLPSRRIAFDPEDRLIKADALRALLPRLAARDWSVIHIHTPFRAHQLGVRLARANGRPTLESYHTYFEQYVAAYLPWLPGRLGRWAVRAFSRRLCADVDHLLVPSRQMADVLASYGIDTPSTIVPTGVRLEEFQGGDGARFRAAHGVAADAPLLVTVGRVALEKNIAFLLEVVRVLVAEFPRLVFVIAGEGPDAPRLASLVEAFGLGAHVRFVGNLDRRAGLLDCYRAADVFVFASRTETQGLVLIEAMALGVPIVSTAAMGAASVLEGARSARTSEEDVGAFAREVASLLGSPAQRRALAQAGPADAQAWSAASLMRGVVELYARLESGAASRARVAAAGPG
ncbi:MAG TPA: glycosyltransferase [Dokdonella sp.]|nr:glycosyltransferase [Dokdonella sp.]